MTLRTVCFGALMAASAAQVGAADQADQLRLRVSPLTAFAPANVRVHAVIESDPANRAVEVVAESAEFYRSSEIPLEGDRAPRTTSLELRSLPAGLYRVTATLRGADGKERASVAQDLSVLASGAP